MFIVQCSLCRYGGTLLCNIALEVIALLRSSEWHSTAKDIDPLHSSEGHSTPKDIDPLRSSEGH